MPFRDDSRLDTSQIDDQRGRRIGSKTALGGGGLGIGIVVLILALVFGLNPSEIPDFSVEAPAGSAQSAAETSNLEEQCRTGADANQRQDCRIVGFVNSIQSYWTSEFSARGSLYVIAKTQLYTGATQGACGYATAAVGPFYCPSDRKVYVDLSFFEELQTRFKATGGTFAEAYVLAHEYGHHVQNIVGLLESSGGSATGPDSMSVKTELIADCLAGVWANHAASTGYLLPLTEAEVAQSLDTAAAVGDDRIQKQTQGYVSPEKWTHGSSQQRQSALMNGLRTGDMDVCLQSN